MISNKQTKLIISLRNKKFRDKLSQYIVEGDKIVREYLDSGEKVIMLVAKAEWLKDLPADLLKKAASLAEATDEELKKVSALKTPHKALAIIEKKEYNLKHKALDGRLTMALDFVQDPGNLGTIIRLAAWFGVEDIVCSQDCVDIYNPKVIQSTMGALLSTRVHYTGLQDFLSEARQHGNTIYGTSLSGESVYQADLKPWGIILLGNESRGISRDLLKYVDKEIHIPGRDVRMAGVESLNVATAAGIICSEFRRRST